MRNHVRKSVLGVLLVAVLLTTVPAMAVSRAGNAPHDLFSRIRQIIAHILDVVDPTEPPPPDNKGTFPPG
jgi:branched-subunit amino acid permease